VWLGVSKSSVLAGEITISIGSSIALKKVNNNNDTR
jgi:hypothetical protein